MFKDIDWSDEDALYDRILAAWKSAQLTEKDADVWLSQFVLDVLHQDRNLNHRKKSTLARIVSNCLVLALALTKKKSAELWGCMDVKELAPEEREKILHDLASVLDE